MSSHSMHPDLDNLRQQIAHLDAELLGIVQKRFQLVHRVAEYKYTHAMKIRSQEVEENLIARNLKHGAKLGLDSELVESLTYLLIDHSLQYQMEFFQNEECLKIQCRIDGIIQNWKSE